MTEEEAKTKWCPFARLIAGTETESGAQIRGDTGAAFNRISVRNGEIISTPHAAKCIASSCMVWSVPRRLTHKDGFTFPNVDGNGYCGLAGAPQ